MRGGERDVSALEAAVAPPEPVPEPIPGLEPAAGRRRAWGRRGAAQRHAGAAPSSPAAIQEPLRWVSGGAQPKPARDRAAGAGG